MHKCFSDIDLAAFTDGRLDAAKSAAIRLHATDCPSCAEALANALELRDLAAADLLPPLTGTEREAAIRQLATQRKTAAGVLRFPAAAGSESAGPSEEQSISRDLFLAGTAAAGVAAMATTSVFSQHPAASAAASLEQSVDHVRKGDAQDSLQTEGHDRSHEKPSEEGSHMRDPDDSSRMQLAIDEFFGHSPDASVEAPDHVGQASEPNMFSPDVSQAYSDTCAIRCQELVLKDFGLDLSQTDLMHEAQGQGWYVPGMGTLEGDLGRLIESHGIPVHQYEKANVFNLVGELAQGHRVIVSIDSGELWKTNEILKSTADLHSETWEDSRPDHAVIVSGVDISDPSNPVVVVTDPGTGEVAARYSLPDFLEAWEDSGFSMVATDVAPPQFPVDHVAWIGTMPYEEFSRMLPSVENLTGNEPGFAGLCASFHQALQDAGDSIIDSIQDRLPGQEHNTIVRAEDNFFPQADHSEHHEQGDSTDSDQHHVHDV
jgi:hypothetical protein